MARGYLQCLLVGNYRLPRVGGTPGMDAMPAQIIAAGLYRYTRNRCISPPIFMTDSSAHSGRGSRSSCLLLAQCGSSGGVCTTRRGSKGRSALNIPRTDPGEAMDPHSD